MDDGLTYVTQPEPVAATPPEPAPVPVLDSDPADDLAQVERLEQELARVESELHALDDGS